MANFLVKFTLPKEVEVEIKAEAVALGPVGKLWTLHIDGVSNVVGSRAGMILTRPNGVVAKQVLHFCFKTLNKEAEYEALLGYNTLKSLATPN